MLYSAGWVGLYKHRVANKTAFCFLHDIKCGNDYSVRHSVHVTVCAPHVKSLRNVWLLTEFEGRHKMLEYGE